MDSLGWHWGQSSPYMEQHTLCTHGEEDKCCIGLGFPKLGPAVLPHVDMGHSKDGAPYSKEDEDKGNEGQLEVSVLRSQSEFVGK